MENANPDVDAYIENAQPFAQPILEKIRKAFHKGCPQLEEKLKWGVPSFEYEGILGGMAAFKKHVGFGFWKAALMDDPEGLFQKEPRASPMRIKIFDVKELPTQKALVAYVKNAVALNESGAKVPKAKPKKRSKSSLRVPAYMLTAIKADPDAFATWKGFSYSNQKEYLEWVTGAKRDATRERRLAQAVEWMGEGKSRNWKYQ